jgi:hypothetical protein
VIIAAIMRPLPSDYGVNPAKLRGAPQYASPHERGSE